MILTEIPGNANQNPIPLGVRLNDLIFGPAIIGKDLQTGELGQGLDQQLELAFRNLRTLVERGGGSIDNVAHVTLFMNDLGERLAFNRYWIEMFPDEHDRPPFKYMPAQLPDGVLVQLQVFAVVGQRRRILEIPGVAHRDPMPLAVHIGDQVFSSRIMGTDPAAPGSSVRPERQAELAFAHMRNLLGQAGAVPTDLSQITVFVTSSAYLDAVDGPWAATFPDSEQQPALHPVTVNLPGPQVRLEFIASVPTPS